MDVRDIDTMTAGEILEKIGVERWLALAYVFQWGHWPTTISDDKILEYRDLGFSGKLGVLTETGRSIGARFYSLGPLVIDHFQAIGDPTMADVVRGILSMMHDPEATIGTRTAEAIGADINFDNVDDPNKVLSALKDIMRDPAALRAASSELAEMMGFLKKVHAAVEKMSPTIKAHYRGELAAIGKDFVHDLGMGNVSDDRITHALLFLLQFGDDDDDGPTENTLVPTRDGDELVPA